MQKLLFLSCLLFTFWFASAVGANHNCGADCNQYTAEGACTHGCYAGGAPNPDYRNPEEGQGPENITYGQSTTDWQNYYQQVQQQQQQAAQQASQTTSQQTAQEAAQNTSLPQNQQSCIECVNCANDHLKPYCSTIAGGHHPQATPKPGETPSPSYKLRDEIQRIEQYNLANNIIDASGNHNFFVESDGTNKYFFKQADGNYVLSDSPTSPTGAKSAADFGGKTGVEKDNCQSTSPLEGCQYTDTGTGKCSSSLGLCTVTGGRVGNCFYCPGGMNSSIGGTSICTPSEPGAKSCGTFAAGTTMDCVAIANQYCAPVQVDVDRPGNQGASSVAVTCYPTSYAACGKPAPEVTIQGGGRPTAQVTTQNGGGGETPPPGGPPPPTAPQCNQACGSGCPANLTCVGGVCRNPACTTEADCACPGSSFQCQQVKVFRNNTEITVAQIELGDVITFRGFASATNTTVSKLRFVLTKGGVAQTPVDINATLVGALYQADYQVTIDTATSYLVTATPISP